ncbi:MAG TPA: hypothetical protein VFI06_02920, partial [Chitinophagaceae bacterium]|nr:hypothetical protein [Chitinophagaceae bacterium]
MNLSDVKTSLSDSITMVESKLKDSFSFLKDMKEASIEKVNKLVNDILGLAPLIETTGFNMREVSVDMGIPPGISISFIKERDVDAETIHQLLEENKDKEILKLIIRGLQKADSLQKGMNLSHYLFRG